jgi:hypothetical protein
MFRLSGGHLNRIYVNTICRLASRTTSRYSRQTGHSRAQACTATCEPSNGAEHTRHLARCWMTGCSSNTSFLLRLQPESGLGFRLFRSI